MGLGFEVFNQKNDYDFRSRSFFALRVRIDLH